MKRDDTDRLLVLCLAFTADRSETQLRMRSAVIRKIGAQNARAVTLTLILALAVGAATTGCRSGGADDDRQADQPEQSDAIQALQAVEGVNPAAAASETPEPVDTGLLQGKYAEKFTSGDVERTDLSYRSENVSVTVEQVELDGPIVYYVADIYIKDLSSLRTAVAIDYKDQNDQERKSTMPTLKLAQLTGAIVAISGDNYGFRNEGLIAIRNGEERFSSLPLEDDICVLYYDGTMETYSSEEARGETLDAILNREPYQIWCFGPQLLKDGEVMDHYCRTKSNPLAGIGYFEPGHYCFILVDGRQAGYSIGMNPERLAGIFKDLGCTVAYNLDGGITAVMTYNDAWISHPPDESPRSPSDIIYIGEPLSADDES